MAAVVSLTSASVHLAGRPVLSDVTLALEPGECVALLGANGSGKSTLVRALVGLVPLTSGRLELFGTPVERFHDWPRLGYVPQRLTAAPGVPASVGEVVLSGRLPRMRRLHRASAADRCAVECALETVGLIDRARDPVASLSGGQQQRVLIARALAGDPEVLLLDEPTSAVDLPGQRAFAATLRAFVDSGLAVLLVAHELGPLADVVRRRVVLRDGRAVTGAGDPGPDHAHHPEPEPLSTGPRLA